MHKISIKISNVKNSVYDIGDVGNEIGIAVGKIIKCEEDKEYFIDGLKRGISLIDGTHDLGENICETKSKKKKTKKRKKRKQ